MSTDKYKSKNISENCHRNIDTNNFIVNDLTLIFYRTCSNIKTGEYHKIFNFLLI